MIRKIGLEANAGLYSVLLLQGFATRSLQFEIFLTVIILQSTAEARILFYYRKKKLSWRFMFRPTVSTRKWLSIYMFHIIRYVPPPVH